MKGIQEIKPLYDKTVRCLFCDTLFQTKRIRSRFVRVKEVHSDFYTEYKDPKMNPVFYEIDVCPHCGFASSETFSTYFPDGTDLAISEQFKIWKKQDYGRERTIEDAIKALKLGVLSALLKKEKYIVTGGLCLRLAWMYRLIQDHEQEHRFLQQALDQYQLSYQQSDFVGTSMTEMRLSYLIGELSRRTGQLSEAIRYFSGVINHKNKLIEPKLVEMAREQWYVMKSGKKANS